MGLMAERGATADAGAADLQNHGAHAAAPLFVQSKVGTKEDFSSREEPAETAAAPSPSRSPSPSTWVSWSGSPSCGIRASSPTRSSRPRRSSSSGSETG